MLKTMEAAADQAADASWSVYVLSCKGGTLYTGVAKDVNARFEMHCQGKGAAYTRSHPPERIVYREDGLTRSQALIREARVKAMSRTAKLALIGSYSDEERNGRNRRMS